MTTEYEALLRAVRADPDADLPRLVLADWLEENGQGPRAGFIRRQIENAANPCGRMWTGPKWTRLIPGEAGTLLEGQLVPATVATFEDILRVDPWAIYPQHFSPMLVVGKTLRTCVGYYRGFQAFVSCSRWQWQDFGPWFLIPPELLASPWPPWGTIQRPVGCRRWVSFCGAAGILDQLISDLTSARKVTA